MIEPVATHLQLHLPEWVSALSVGDKRYTDDAAKVALAIRLALGNVEHDSGGPFGAAVFTADGMLVAAGVNLSFQEEPPGTAAWFITVGLTIYLGGTRVYSSGSRRWFAAPARLAAVAGSLAALGELGSHEAHLGACRHVCIEAEGGHVVLCQARSEHLDVVVCVAGGTHSGLGQMLYTTRQHASRLAAALDAREAVTS